MTEHNHAQDRDHSGSDLVFFGIPQVYVAKGAHVAHFFRGEDERVNILVNYVQAGLNAGDLCAIITESGASALINERLAGTGVDVPAAMASGQLQISYGGTTAQEMSALFESFSSRAKREGRDMVRIGGDMTWTFDKMPNAEKLFEWEAIYDQHFGHRGDFVALCQYDHSRFSGSAIMCALQTHPLSIIGNIVQENPFARNPDEILVDLSRSTVESPL